MLCQLLRLCRYVDCVMVFRIVRSVRVSKAIMLNLRVASVELLFAIGCSRFPSNFKGFIDTVLNMHTKLG